MPSDRGKRPEPTNFPDRKAEHYVFPAEKYGVAGNDRVVRVYSTEPKNPTRSFKEAWEAATNAGHISVEAQRSAVSHLENDLSVNASNEENAQPETTPQ